MLEILSRQFANLLILKAAVEAGSINKAATILRTTQPAVTRSISRLEAAVGCKLIERGARGIVATEFGRLLLGHVAAASAELRTAGKNLSFLQRSRNGDLVCGAAPVSMNSLVPAAVHHFLKGRPRTNVRLVEAPTRLLLQQLRTSELDIAVGLRLDNEEDADFEVEPLIEEFRGIYLRADHPLLKQQPCKMSEILTTQKWVFNEPMPNFIAQKFEGFDFSTIPTIVRTQSTSVMRWYAKMTDYVVISTSLVHFSDLAHGEVAKLETDWDIPATHHVIYRKDRDKTPKAAIDFIDFLKDAVRTERFSIDASEHLQIALERPLPHVAMT
jgi:LysR family pca operon transcriptional activator